MGEARRRGTFEERKAQAIKEGRIKKTASEHKDNIRMSLVLKGGIFSYGAYNIATALYRCGVRT